jgi:hypothetical protein
MEASELEGRVLRFPSACTQDSNKILSATLLFLGFSYPGQVTTLCHANITTKPEETVQYALKLALGSKRASAVVPGLTLHVLKYIFTVLRLLSSNNDLGIMIYW